MKHVLQVLIVLAICIAVVIGVRFLVGGDEDTWICFDGQWTKHGNPLQPSPEVICPGALPSYAPDSWKTWNDSYYSKSDNSQFKYSLEYPRDFDVSQGDIASGGLLTAKPLVKIAFPNDAFRMPRTNFDEAYVVISMGTDRQSLTGCYSLSSVGGNKELIDNVAINGVEFKVGYVTDVAAGNIYSSNVYRTIFSNRCLEVVETVHTGNIQNYPEGSVAEFDKNKATVILDKIIQTLTLSNEGPK